MDTRSSLDQIHLKILSHQKCLMGGLIINIWGRWTDSMILWLWFFSYQGFSRHSFMFLVESSFRHWIVNRERVICVFKKKFSSLGRFSPKKSAGFTEKLLRQIIFRQIIWQIILLFRQYYMTFNENVLFWLYYFSSDSFSSLQNRSVDVWSPWQGLTMWFGPYPCPEASWDIAIRGCWPWGQMNAFFCIE